MYQINSMNGANKQSAQAHGQKNNNFLCQESTEQMWGSCGCDGGAQRSTYRHSRCADRLIPTASGSVAKRTKIYIKKEQQV